MDRRCTGALMPAAGRALSWCKCARACRWHAAAGAVLGTLRGACSIHATADEAPTEAPVASAPCCGMLEWNSAYENTPPMAMLPRSSPRRICAASRIAPPRTT
eukprot:363732-Chlamydomonas_euryale.AAC.6